MSLSGRRGTLLFVVQPLVALLAQATAWIRYGIDVPWMDEWRPYISGREGSLAVDYLFEGFEYGLSPIGRALGSFAYRLIGGNIIAYELVTMSAARQPSPTSQPGRSCHRHGHRPRQFGTT